MRHWSSLICITAVSSKQSICLDVSSTYGGNNNDQTHEADVQKTNLNLPIC